MNDLEIQEMTELLWFEEGLKVISEWQSAIPEAENFATVIFPRCPHCRRRPELRVSRWTQLWVRTGFDKSNYASISGVEPPPEFIMIPRYEIIRCCSATYIRQVDHVTRRQRLMALKEKKT